VGHAVVDDGYGKFGLIGEIAQGVEDTVSLCLRKALFRIKTINGRIGIADAAAGGGRQQYQDAPK
jgi:hypothetical protein